MYFPELGYKIEVMPGDSTLVDVFQPLITLKFGDFEEKYVELNNLFKDISHLFKRYHFGSINWVAVAGWRVTEELKNLNLMKRHFREDLETGYEEENHQPTLRSFQIYYDENNNIINSKAITENLEKRLKKAIICIYKNLIPIYGEEFDLKFTSKPNIVLLTNYREYELMLGHYAEKIVDFLDMFYAMKSLYKIEKLSPDLEKFIKNIEIRIEKL